MQWKVKRTCTDVCMPPMTLPCIAIELDGHTVCYWMNRFAAVEDKKIVLMSFLGGKKDT